MCAEGSVFMLEMGRFSPGVVAMTQVGRAELPVQPGRFGAEKSLSTTGVVDVTAAEGKQTIIDQLI